ncbi:unnamed protein product [Ambrosiozyma monospora]|uniref:Nitrogen permease regulator 3 n=1 Tax=Ambrosiozyma monospora TaxID=43982 RepID=A0A9W7DLR5_AMBMO|nr:unnamed protein product [Ambrosiozyma monospora]
MSSLYLPNPCLLGIILTISTEALGDNVVFHYPPFPKNYGYKPTPMGNTVLQTGDDDYSSDEDETDDTLQQHHQLHGSNPNLTDSSSDQLAAELAALGGLGAGGSNYRKNSNYYDESDGSSNEGGSRASFGSGHSHFNGNGLSGSFPGVNLNRKEMLELLDEKDRKKKKREENRQALMKNIIMGDQTHPKAKPNDTSPLQQPSVSGVGSEVASSIAGMGPYSGKNHPTNTNAHNTIAGSTNLTSNVGKPADNNSQPQSQYEFQQKKQSDPKISSIPTSEDYTIDKLFGLSINLVADLLSPNDALCNERFEFTVDDMSFLGLPIRKDRKTGRWRARTHKREQDTNTQATGERRRSAARKKKRKGKNKAKKVNRKESNLSENDASRVDESYYDTDGVAKQNIFWKKKEEEIAMSHVQVSFGVCDQSSCCPA